MSEGAPNRTEGTPIVPDFTWVHMALQRLDDLQKDVKDLKEQLQDRDIKRIKQSDLQTVIFNRTVYLPRISCESPPFAEQSIERQTTSVLLRLKSLLCDAGTTLEHLLRVSVYLDDLRKEPKMREAWDEFFESEGIPEDVRPVPIVHAVRMLQENDEVEMIAEAALPTAASGGPSQSPIVLEPEAPEAPEPEAPEPEPEAQEHGEYWTDEDGYQCTADVNAWKETQHGPGWQKYGPLIDAPESCPDNLYVCTVKSNNRTDRYFRLFDEQTGGLLFFEDCDAIGQRRMNVRQEVLRSKVAVNRYLSAV